MRDRSCAVTGLTKYIPTLFRSGSKRIATERQCNLEHARTHARHRLRDVGPPTLGGDRQGRKSDRPGLSGNVLNTFSADLILETGCFPWSSAAR